MSKKGLIVPGLFVPSNDTVTLLSYKHLRNIDAKMDVVALSGNKDFGIENNLKKDKSFLKFNIEYFKEYNDVVATFEKKNVISGFFNIFKYCFYCIKKFKNNKYDFIYTSSIPSFTHFVGYFIKKFINKDVIWVASFSDPLYKSPYKKDIDSFKEYSFIQKIGFYVYIFIYMNGFYEKIAQKYADKIIYICEEQRDFMLSHYKNNSKLYDKSLIIPLNYIKDWNIYTDLLKFKKVNNKTKVISHFGRIYGLRKIDTLLKALKELKDEIPNLSDLIVFKQYGQILPRYTKIIDDYGVEDIFKCYDKISYSKVIEEMCNSDYLALYDTLIDADIQPYLPSKSLEYILFKKDLFILTCVNSPAYRIFKEYGYTCTLNNLEDIKNRIKYLIYNDIKYYDYDVYNLENEIITKQLVEFIGG